MTRLTFSPSLARVARRAALWTAVAMLVFTVFGCRDKTPAEGTPGSWNTPLAVGQSAVVQDLYRDLEIKVTEVTRYTGKGAFTDDFRTCAAKPGSDIVRVDFEVTNNNAAYQEVRFDWELFTKAKGGDAAHLQTTGAINTIVSPASIALGEPAKADAHGGGHGEKKAEPKKDGAKKDDGHGDDHHDNTVTHVAHGNPPHLEPPGTSVYPTRDRCPGMLKTNIEFPVNEGEATKLSVLFDVKTGEPLDRMRHFGAYGDFWFDLSKAKVVSN